jgi:hypothetical protein
MGSWRWSSCGRGVPERRCAAMTFCARVDERVARHDSRALGACLRRYRFAMACRLGFRESGVRAGLSRAVAGADACSRSCLVRGADDEV